MVQIGALPSYNANQVENMEVLIPNKKEQYKIGELLVNLDKAITLHQRKYYSPSKVLIMISLQGPHPCSPVLE